MRAYAALVAFPRRLLNEHEEVVLDLRPHWRSYLRPALVLVVAVSSLVAAAVLALHEWLLLALAAVTIVALVWFATRYARWGSTSFVVTSDRLIHRSGVLSKRGVEIPLERVNTVFFNQSLLERLLGTGDLVIESGGEQGAQRVSDIGRPSVVQNEIHRQIEENQRRILRRRHSGTSLADRLAELEELRRRGMVSDEEFVSKRASLLDDL